MNETELVGVVTAARPMGRVTTLTIRGDDSTMTDALLTLTDTSQYREVTKDIGVGDTVRVRGYEQSTATGGVVVKAETVQRVMVAHDVTVTEVALTTDGLAVGFSVNDYDYHSA